MALLRVILLRTFTWSLGEGLGSELGMLLWISSQCAAKLTFTGDAFPGQDFESTLQRSQSIRAKFQSKMVMLWSQMCLLIFGQHLPQSGYVWLNLYGPPICRISLKMTTSKGPQFWAGAFWYLELAIRGTKAKSYNGIWVSFIGCSIPTSFLAILSVIFACSFPFHKIWNWVMGMQHSPWTWRLLRQILFGVNCMLFFKCVRPTRGLQRLSWYHLPRATTEVSAA